MKQNHNNLINELTADLKPVKVLSVPKVTILWLMATFISSIVFLLLVMPFRENFMAQLAQSTHFLIESLLGLTLISFLAYKSIDSLVPSEHTGSKQGYLALALAISWIGIYAFGYIEPALSPSSLGMRPHCSIEVIVYAIPSLAIGLLITSKQWPLTPTISGLFIGLAAGAVPAFLMQFACAYETTHIIIYHLLPGVCIGLLGALLANRFIKKP